MITIIIPTVGKGGVKEASTKALKESIKGRDDVKVREVTHDEAKSWGHAINVGLSERDGDVVIMDDDVIVDHGWLEQFELAFEHEKAKDVGIVGARLRFPDGRLQHAGCSVLLHMKGEYCVDEWCVENMIGAGVVHLGHGQPNMKYGEPSLCPHVTFSLCYIKGEVIDKVGMVDADYFTGAQYEDIDYSFRALEKGFKIMYWPGCTAVHHQTHSKSHLLKGRLEGMAKENERLMNERWMHKPARLRSIGVIP